MKQNISVSHLVCEFQPVFQNKNRQPKDQITQRQATESILNLISNKMQRKIMDLSTMSTNFKKA
jgi:hypothetical protein